MDLTSCGLHCVAIVVPCPDHPNSNRFIYIYIHIYLYILYINIIPFWPRFTFVLKRLTKKEICAINIRINSLLSHWTYNYDGLHSWSRFVFFSFSLTIYLWFPNHLALLLVRCLLFTKKAFKGVSVTFLYPSSRFFTEKKKNFKNKKKKIAWPKFCLLQLWRDWLRYITVFFIVVLSFSLSFNPLFLLSTQLSLLKICLCLYLAQAGSSEYHHPLLSSSHILFPT